jgi:very-short-patch-repair endonuclease
MVRLADIIKVRHRTRKSQLWQSRLGNKHIDFVLCDVETLEVKLTIELLDAAVPDREQTTRQRFLTSALSSAGLPLLRVHEETKYETAELRRLIDHALGITRKKKKW